MWTFVTVPALLFCCLYASGMLGTIAPKGWHPPEATPAEQAEHAKLAALAARTRLAAQAHQILRRKWRKLGAPPGSRIFGVAIAGNALPKWYRGTGIHPQLLMTFQNWSTKPMPTSVLRQDQKVGIRTAMITWEPWAPKPFSANAAAQFAPQKGYTNKDIADGDWDPYIRQWARDIAKFPHITVYIRYAHEMNGVWYPWSHAPHEYVKAWRHIVRIFRGEHVTNAKFVWSADLGVGPPTAADQQRLMEYWPGGSYVDAIGTTMINFGGLGHTHPVSQFVQRLALMHQELGKPTWLTEVDTAQAGRVRWMLDLAKFAEHTPWLKGVVLSQLRSHGAGNLLTGNMKWQVSKQKSPRARRAFRDLALAASWPATPVHSRRVSAGA